MSLRSYFSINCIYFSQKISAVGRNRPCWILQIVSTFCVNQCIVQPKKKREKKNTFLFFSQKPTTATTKNQTCYPLSDFVHENQNGFVQIPKMLGDDQGQTKSINTIKLILLQVSKNLFVRGVVQLQKGEVSVKQFKIYLNLKCLKL